jgi:anaerobic magnesium-protoporphyrin IX monomethyl ester cyclase
MRRHRIVLYNPRAPFFTMPLAVLAVGSALDRSKYEVVVVDGRVEADPVRRVLAETETATCLGISVLTGLPIRDALNVTEAVRLARPHCRIVWGGWHPSLFPIDTLREAGVDAVVIGQGEETFAQIVERFAAGESARDVAGCVACHEAARPQGPGIRPQSDDICLNPPRATRDINAFPAHDFGLIDVERFFALKHQRQLDYVTSQGCRFRCTFCADPTVFGRAWFGLEPARIGDELDALWKRYAFTDVGFQDETFFTHGGRVAAIAEEILRRDLSFSWMATMRADQGARLDEAVLSACRSAGLRRVMVGIESGSQDMLDWMKKDITLNQVFVTAEKCRRHGVGVLFNLIVGFPDEPASSVAATLAVAKQLRAFGPEFQVALFHYRPYPGTPITDDLARRGQPLPRTLAEWAAIEDRAASSPWVDRRKAMLIERFGFYQRIGWARPSPLRAPIQAIARWRCRGDRYAFPIEKAVVEWLRGEGA